MKPAIPRLEVSREELLNLLEHARTEALSEPEYQQLKAALDTLVYLTQLVEDKNTTIARLRQILFGASSEKMSQVLETLAAHRAPSREPDGGGKSEEEKPRRSRRGGPQPGTWAQRLPRPTAVPASVKIEHSSLKSGNHCPGCQKGKLYAWATPGVLIRVVGQAPLAATVYELEKLRCNLCGEVFTAEPPEGVGTEKYDAAAASMIALLKYGSGLPFNRLEGLQGDLGVPLPASTQWEIVAETAEWIEPIYQELIRQAAQGEVLHNDDTTMKILALMGESRPRQPSAEEELRGEIGAHRDFHLRDRVHACGTEDRAVLHRPQACGRKSGDGAGATREGVGAADPDVRRTVAQSPRRVSDVVANCLAHGRRKFVEVAAKFPEECRHVLETLAEVYQHEAVCREQACRPRNVSATTKAERSADERAGAMVPGTICGTQSGAQLRSWAKRSATC